MLTLIAWAAKRARSSEAEERRDEESVLATALEAIDGFLADVAGNALDVSWYDRPNAGPSASTARLKVNPQNVANQDKKVRLDRWVAKCVHLICIATDPLRINREDQARDACRKRYAALRVDLSRPALPLGPPDLSSPLTSLASPADVLRYGRSIRALAASPLSPGAAAPAREPPSATVDVEAELALSFRSMRLQAADVRASTQQIERYVHQADVCAGQRLAEASRALTAAHAESPDWPLAPRADRRPPGPDPILLLRAISRHDARRQPA